MQVKIAKQRAIFLFGGCFFFTFVVPQLYLFLITFSFTREKRIYVFMISTFTMLLRFSSILEENH